MGRFLGTSGGWCNRTWVGSGHGLARARTCQVRGPVGSTPCRPGRKPSARASIPSGIHDRGRLLMIRLHMARGVTNERGRNGYVRAVGRRPTGTVLDEPVTAVPLEYTTAPLIRPGY